MEDEEYTVECTEEELFELTESMLENDENNCTQYFRWNVQDRREGCEDVNNEPLFTDVDYDALFQVPTVKTLLALHDNYEPCVSEEEEVTREEIQEERDFIDSVVETKPMEIAREFMIKKGLISDDLMSFKRFLHRMWFSLYPRARRNKGIFVFTYYTLPIFFYFYFIFLLLGSCAFEHVFLGEVKNGKVNGFHNWIFFLMEEQKGDVDYYGFNYILSFNNRKGAVIKTVFEWEGVVKPVSGIFLGLSPEMEMALYTLCTLLKPDEPCTVKLGGKTIDITTHIYRHRGKKYLGTAFPDL